MIASPPPLLWILGRGGMLGSRLCAAIPTQLPGSECWTCPITHFSWRSQSRLADELNESAARFAEAVRKRCGSWGVLWAAGAGVIGSGEEDLAAETANFQLVLKAVDANVIPGGHSPGLVFLASSAGGVYGNCSDQMITESSECRPISAYGRNKQRQENILNAWADERAGVTCRIGRISNLYGIGQNLNKQQGLISHISRCMIWQRPIHIYVPLDTIRDYLHVDDCARQIAFCVGEWLSPTRNSDDSSAGRIKLFVASQPTSVAQIIGCFAHLASHRQPRVICAPSPLGLQQPRRLFFRSVTPPSFAELPTTPLQLGISAVHQHQLSLFHRGRLSPPPARI